MIPWKQRPREERALLNPAYCASILWHAAGAHSKQSGGGITYEEAFLVLPFVLSSDIRTTLPRSTRTSLPVWLDEHPTLRAKLITHARLLVPFTREALTFGGLHEIFVFEAGRVEARTRWKSAMKTLRENLSDEVRASLRAGDLVGRWFAHCGSATTVFALLGARP